MGTLTLSGSQSQFSPRRALIAEFRNEGVNSYRKNLAYLANADQLAIQAIQVVGRYGNLIYKSLLITKNVFDVFKDNTSSDNPQNALISTISMYILDYVSYAAVSCDYSIVNGAPQYSLIPGSDGLFDFNLPDFDAVYMGKPLMQIQIYLIGLKPDQANISFEGIAEFPEFIKNSTPIEYLHKTQNNA